jgi:hypothetical protein
MGAVRRRWNRFTSWWGRSRSDGPGPEDHSASSAYDEAKFRAQMDTTRGINNV